MKIYVVASDCELCYDNIKFEKAYESKRDALAYKCKHKVIIEMELVKKK